MKPLFILFTALTLLLPAGNFFIWAEADEPDVSRFRGKESEHNCGDCHKVIAERYARSSHSTSYSNPFYQKLIDNLPKEKVRRCNRCHLPKPLFFNGRVPQLAATGQTVIKDGIACTTCHQTKDSVMLGPFDAVESPHMSRNSQKFTESATCTVCHGDGEFDLVKSWKSGGFSDTECIECHMPQTSGKAVQHFSFIDLPDRDIGSHLFPASNSPDMVERSIAVDVAEIDGGLRLVITNSGAGHLLPGGRFSAFRLTVWRQKENVSEKEIFTAEISQKRHNRLPPGGSLSYQVKIKKGTKVNVQLECVNLLISMELARNNPVYEDMATKFFEHFLYIANAMNNMGHEGVPLWDDEDEFFYDVLHVHGQKPYHMKIRSVVGLVPLFAVSVFDLDLLAELPEFKVRMEWFLENHKDLCANVACMRDTGVKGKGLLSIVRKDKLAKILSRLLSEEEFLSPYGIRALSKFHKEHPFIYNHNGREHRVDYEPAESRSGLFGGNSNWRGPIWFPMNYLLIESLKKYHDYFGDTLKVEYPTGSGNFQTLDKVKTELSKRLISIFIADTSGRKPLFGDSQKFQNDEHFKDHILFYEYFNGDNGAGVGASHQTGWTGLVANLIKKAAP